MGIATAHTLDGEIAAIGTFSSVVLALIAVFTQQRYSVWDSQDRGLKLSWWGARVALAIDFGLCLFTAAVLVALGPLMVDAVDELSLFETRGALRGLFGLVWIGLLGLFLFQIWIAARRARKTRWGEISRTG